MTVKSLLQDKGNYVSVIRSNDRVQEVIDRLEADDVSALVVSDDNQDILGIVSNGDVVRGLQQFAGEVVEKPVSALMTRDVVACDIGEPMSKILELMDAHQIRHVPITSNGKLCGIINMLDVVKYRLKEMELETEALKNYVAGQT